MNANANRSMLFGVVGGYLIYLAYELLKGMIDKTPTKMPAWLTVLVIVIFVGAGGALIVFAWKSWRKSREDQDQNPVDIEQQENELKEETAKEAETEPEVPEK